MGDAQGRVGYGLVGVSRTESLERAGVGARVLGSKAYGALGRLLWCRVGWAVPLAGVFEVRRAAESVRCAAVGTRSPRVVVLGAEELGSLLLALL